MDTEKISFTVTSVKEQKTRKKGEVTEKSLLTLNSENQEKAVIEAPDSDYWKSVKPGDVVHLTVAVKQRTMQEIEAEDRAKAEARKKEIDAAKEKAARAAGAGPKKASAQS